MILTLKLPLKKTWIEYKNLARPHMIFHAHDPLHDSRHYPIVLFWLTRNTPLKNSIPYGYFGITGNVKTDHNELTYGEKMHKVENMSDPFNKTFSAQCE